MTVSRKVLSLAVLVGGWSILSPTFAEAKNARPNAKNKALRALVSARQTEAVSPDLGFGTVPLPLNQRQVNQFLRTYFRNPNPRISPHPCGPTRSRLRRTPAVPSPWKCSASERS